MSGRRPRLLPLLAALLLSACAAVPPGGGGDTPLPARFEGVGGERAAPAQWWREFDDPALDALVEQALAGNPGLAAVDARLRQARAVWRQSEAGARPSADLAVTATEGTTTLSSGVEADAGARTLRLSAAYEVDLWGRIEAEAQGGAFNYAATAEDRQSAALTLAAEVARQWYTVAERRQELVLLAEQASTAGDYLEVLRLRFAAGQARTADVLQQRDLVASLEAEQAQAAAALAAARHALAALLGRAPGEAPEAGAAQLPALAPLPATGVPSELVTRRPDLRRAFYALRAAEAEVAVAVAQRFPRLNLTGSVSSREPQWEGLLERWTRTLSAELLAPLLDGGRRRAEVERTRAVVAERLADYREAILAALVDVEDALALEQGQRRYIERLERRLALGREVLARQRDYYRSGGGDFLNVLEAQRSLQAREREFIVARRQLVDYRIALYRALAGGILDRPTPAQPMESIAHVR